VANILRWESIVIDPIGAALAVLVYEFIISGSGTSPWGHTLLLFCRLVLVGALVGISSGHLLGRALRSNWLPDYLRNIGTLSLVIVSFICANALQNESGLVTVTVMGIWLANMKNVDVQGILDFKESISLLLISLLFIILAARIDLQALFDLGWRALLLFFVIQFLARPLNVIISTRGSKLTWPERHFALPGLRPRIFAAAISSLFAVQLAKSPALRCQTASAPDLFVIIARSFSKASPPPFIARGPVVEPRSHRISPHRRPSRGPYPGQGINPQWSHGPVSRHGPRQCRQGQN
jgi:NhaP-type Na+/H+ or K+/H+ antiporter